MNTGHTCAYSVEITTDCWLLWDVNWYILPVVTSREYQRDIPWTTLLYCGMDRKLIWLSCKLIWLSSLSSLRRKEASLIEIHKESKSRADWKDSRDVRSTYWCCYHYCVVSNPGWIGRTAEMYDPLTRAVTVIVSYQIHDGLEGQPPDPLPHCPVTIGVVISIAWSSKQSTKLLQMCCNVSVTPSEANNRGMVVAQNRRVLVPFRKLRPTYPQGWMTPNLTCPGEIKKINFVMEIDIDVHLMWKSNCPIAKFTFGFCPESDIETSLWEYRPNSRNTFKTQCVDWWIVSRCRFMWFSMRIYLYRRM